MKAPKQVRRPPRGIRPYLSALRRPRAGLKGEFENFWAAIAQGESTDAAAVASGISSAVGESWFRHGGGMYKPTTSTPTKRYLSLPEREEIALLKAQGQGVREIARHIGRSPIDNLSRIAAQCSPARGSFRLSGHDR